MPDACLDGLHCETCLFVPVDVALLLVEGIGTQTIIAFRFDPLPALLVLEEEARPVGCGVDEYFRPLGPKHVSGPVLHPVVEGAVFLASKGDEVPASGSDHHRFHHLVVGDVDDPLGVPRKRPFKGRF